MQSKIKSDVLNEIMKWADGMGMERIRGKKEPHMDVQVEVEPPHEEPKHEDMPRSDEEGISLDDLLNLEKEYK